MYNHMILFRAEMQHTDKRQIRTINRAADKKTAKPSKKTTRRLSGFFSHSTMAAMVLIPVLASMNGMI